jgi:hypothetical protein
MKVTHLNVSRLFNMGNYENCKFEVSVELHEGDKPGEAIAKLQSLLERLEPNSPVSEYDLRDARKMLETPASELRPYQLENIESYKKRVQKHEEWLAKREQALEEFDELGGNEAFTDAKENWNDD